MKVVKDKSVTFRLPSDDYNWLAQAQPEVSHFLRYLVQEARRKDENRPLKVRIAETQNALDKESDMLLTMAGHRYINSPEMKGPMNRQRKKVEILGEKLARLSGKL